MITIIEPDPSISATTYPILVQLFSVGRGVLVYAWQHYDGWLVYVGSTMSTSGIGDRVCLLCLHVGAAYPRCRTYTTQHTRKEQTGHLFLPILLRLFKYIPMYT